MTFSDYRKQISEKTMAPLSWHCTQMNRIQQPWGTVRIPDSSWRTIMGEWIQIRELWVQMRVGIWISVNSSDNTILWLKEWGRYTYSPFLQKSTSTTWGLIRNSKGLVFNTQDLPASWGHNFCDCGCQAQQRNMGTSLVEVTHRQKYQSWTIQGLDNSRTFWIWKVGSKLWFITLALSSLGRISQFSDF